MCIAIWELLQPIYLPAPTAEIWKASEAGYREIWGFPNCAGSVDGKHVRLECPRNSGSNYFCYKLFFSIVLLAIVDPFYKFLVVDIGSYGRLSDSGIFENSTFYNKYIAGNEILPPKPLPGTRDPVPHVLIGDEGFGLKPYMMRPFPKVASLADENKRRFNYRLCRARRTVENVFGILSEKWRVFHRPIQCNVETAIHIVKAACCLHNYVRSKEGHNHNTTSPMMVETLETSNETQTTSNSAPGNALASLRRTNQRAPNLAFEIREKFVAYFSR